MDACRADSNDLSLPEVADLAEALRNDPALQSEWACRQRSDRVVGAAMHDVSVPAGLAERILAAAASIDETQLMASTEQAIAAEAGTNALIVPQPPGQGVSRQSRRQWWQWAGGIAALLVLAVTGWNLWLRPPAKVSRAKLEVIAQSWFDAAVKKRSGRWEQPSVKPPIPFPGQSVSLRLHSWQRLAAVEEPTLVAFDLAGLRYGGSVFLFAARTNKKYEVASVPFTRLNATRGLEIGAWQQEDLIYVLVVDTQMSRLRLDDVLRDPKLAWVPPRH